MSSSFVRGLAVVVAAFSLQAQAAPPTKPSTPAASGPTPVTRADWCKRLVPRLPTISAAQCERSGLVHTGAASRKGFPILARRIAPAEVAKRGPEPMRVMLLGGIHGDELTASAIVFQWMQWAQSGQARRIEWNVVPVLNPDGLLAPKPQRVNANGVDLNRNFPTANWLQEAPRYWENATRKDPRRFPGAAPLSEPESLWLDAEIARFKPHVIVSVHAPYGVLDFDGPAQPPRRFGGLVFNRVGIFPGSLGNYGGMDKNVPVVTIELPNALKMPSEAESRRIWQDMLAWMQRNVRTGPSSPQQSTVKTAGR